MGLRTQSPYPSRGPKRVASSAFQQTLSAKRARSENFTAGNAFRAEVERNVEGETMISERGVEDARKRRGEDGREWQDAERRRETRHKMEVAKHREEEDRRKEEEARRKATRRDAVRKKIAGLLKIAVGRVAFQTRLVGRGRIILWGRHEGLKVTREEEMVEHRRVGGDF